MLKRECSFPAFRSVPESQGKDCSAPPSFHFDGILTELSVATGASLHNARKKSAVGTNNADCNHQFIFQIRFRILCEGPDRARGAPPPVIIEQYGDSGRFGDHLVLLVAPTNEQINATVHQHLQVGLEHYIPFDDSVHERRRDEPAY
jgi:hypothetical protein